MNQNFYILIINVMVIYILVLLFQFMLQENIVKVSGVQISFRRFYQKSGIYCERTEHYVLFEVFPMVLFLLRLAQILIRLCFQFRVFVHFQFSATFFVFDVKFTVLKLLKPLMTTSPPNILRLCCGQTSNQRCQTHWAKLWYMVYINNYGTLWYMFTRRMRGAKFKFIYIQILQSLICFINKMLITFC